MCLILEEHEKYDANVFDSEKHAKSDTKVFDLGRT